MSSDGEREPYRSRLYATTSRYGLVRPVQGRYLAGVCAGVGRATGTDPVLWRVLLVVLACFGGVGVLIYLLMWLLVPEEGDTAAPVEALFGQGHASTSPLLTIVLMAVALAALIYLAPRALNLVLLGAAIALGVALLLQHQQRRGGGPGPAAAPAPGGASPPPDPPTDPPPASAPSPPGAGVTGDDPTAPAAPAAPAGRPPSGGFPSGAPPSGPFLSGPPPSATPSGPPPSSAAAEWTAPPPAGTPLSTAGPATAAPPARQPRFPLVTMAFFGTVLVLGGLWLLDLSAPVDVPTAGYVAAALTVTALALVAGAWTGGGRLLIIPGLVLSLALPVATAVDEYRPQPVATRVTWTPTSVAELQDVYEVSFGEGVLDLRQVDFAGREAATTVRVRFGEIRVLLPPAVDLRADAQTRIGAIEIVGTRSGGVSTSYTVDHTGEPGGGTLRMDLHADLGYLEVSR